MSDIYIEILMNLSTYIATRNNEARDSCRKLRQRRIINYDPRTIYNKEQKKEEKKRPGRYPRVRWRLWLCNF